jgi:glutamate-1-semialdehyde aminotransferase
MHWMSDWPTPFPILVDCAKGATVTDIDGNTLDDFCLGDTGSMFGHSPKPVTRAIRRQAERGLTYMLPSEDALAIEDPLGFPVEIRGSLALGSGPRWYVQWRRTEGGSNH